MKRLTAAETAKLVRKALAAQFPETTFSVRSKHYSGGASVDIEYTDGPALKLVNEIVKQFEGCGFDPMQDLKTYNAPRMLNGEEVTFGADYVQVTSRHFSARHLKRAQGRICKRFAVEPLPIKEVNGCAYLTVPGNEPRIGNDWLSNLIYREAQEMSA